MMRLIMATAGRGGLLRRALASLAECDQPTSFAGVTVVENGPSGDARHVCDAASDVLRVRYVHSESPGKNRALNLGLSQLDDATLAILCDDDIRFDSGFLTAYATAATDHPTGHFFGGPFDVDYETPPPEWLKAYLPLSAKGWNPSAEEIRPHRTWFLGFNWAAFAGDLRRVGGFDEDVGPGSPSNSTGDEVAMQKQMHEAGLKAKLITGAKVWHNVPASRCSPQWALDRAYRDGLARGQYVRQKGGLRRTASRITYMLKAIKSRTQLQAGLGMDDPQKHFQAQHIAQKSAGFRAA